jgi:hypothetical protein
MTVGGHGVTQHRFGDLIPLMPGSTPPRDTAVTIFANLRRFGRSGTSAAAVVTVLAVSAWMGPTAASATPTASSAIPTASSATPKATLCLNSLHQFVSCPPNGFTNPTPAVTVPHQMAPSPPRSQLRSLPTHHLTSTGTASASATFTAGCVVLLLVFIALIAIAIIEYRSYRRTSARYSAPLGPRILLKKTRESP